MTTPSSLIELKNILPQSSWPVVIPALRQDALIWQSLQNTDFRELAIAKLGRNPQQWNPANLSFLSLKTDMDPEVLSSTSLAEIDPELRVQAIQTYESHVSEESPVMTLPTACLLALAIKEHYHLTQSWEIIPQTTHWLTAYACLFGWIEKSIPLLRVLPIPIIIHTILANPISPQEQTKILTAISSPMTTQKRLALLRELGHQRQDLSIEVAQNLWRSDQESNTSPQDGQNHLPKLVPAYQSILNLAEDLSSNLTHAEAQLTAGYGDHGTTSLRLAWQTARQIQNSLASQVTQVTAHLGDIEKSKTDLAIAQNHPEIPPKNKAALALIWLEEGCLTEAQSLLDSIEDRSDPMVLLALASSSIKMGNRIKAKEDALQASLLASKLNTESQLLLATRLLEIKMPSEAFQVLESAKQSQPNRRDIIHLSAQAHAAAGAYPQAIHAIHLAVALDPDQMDTQRDFALFHELSGLWPAAMEARTHILELQKDPLPTDYHFLAKCAMKLDQYQYAGAVCTSALEINPEDGLAHALIGEVFLAMEDNEKSQEHLEKAIQHAPDHALPWLALTNFHSQTGNAAEATETLRKASQAAPDQPEIHLALGQDYLQAGSQSQALTSLRRAGQLIDTHFTAESYHLRSRVALPLAKTLFELGHADEALNTIQATFPLPENQVEMLHLQARILIFLQQPEQAIPLLAKALLVNPSDAVINIDYACAQLEANQDLGKAISTLLDLLDNEPENTEALAWLAEALKANGEPAEALTAYRNALGTPLGSDTHWHPRLSIGLAQSALELDQPETALAALQKNWQTSPQNHLIILQTLAAAYKQAHLYDKAIQTARSARELEPSSLENLIWVADFADEIQEYDEAVDALNTAIEIEPNRSDFRLNLGVIYQKVGDFTEAHRTIRRVAEVDQATNQELHTAAEHLIELKQPEDAIMCLKIAVRRCLESAEKEPCSLLILELINIYLELGEHAEALISLDEFLDQTVEKDPLLMGKRAILLNQLKRSDEAYTALDQAFNDNPDSNPLHMAACQIHYADGNLPKALEHAQQAVETITNSPTTISPYTSLALAADIADACLQNQLTNQILQYKLDTPGLTDDLSYLCLRSEFVLGSGEEIDAAKALTAALELSPEHPRVLALQARLTARHGDLSNAHQILQNALAIWGEYQHRENITPAGMLGISEAALELHEWNAAIYLLQEAVQLFPQEPRTHLRLARGLVLRAEYQRLCETLQVIHHSPGSSAVAGFTYKQFEQVVISAGQASDGFNHGDHQPMITHWRVRGQAIFQPISEHARALEKIHHTPDSYAAFLASLRYSREIQTSKKSDIEQSTPSSQQLTQKSEKSILLLVEIALALSQHNPELALATAQEALDASIRTSNPSQPIFYAVQAYIAELAGDMDTASSALESALSHWEDEARWHLWVAEIQQRLAEPDLETILQHLSQATVLEPKNGLHHLKLGQAYFQYNNPQDAIPALEEATRLLSNQSRSWLALARAYQSAGEIAQIFHNAERAAELDPTNIEPFTMLAESALEINNPEKAIQYCQDGLKVDSSHPEILLLQARALDRVGKSPEGLQSFNQALERTPKLVPLMLEYAQLTRRALGIEAQVEALQALTNDHPGNACVLTALAEALVDNNQISPAIIAAQKALQSNQDNLEPLQEAHLHITLGRLMRRNGQLDQAVNYLSKAILIDSESVDSYLELGRVYQDRRQYSTALDAYQQAIALDPGNAQAYYLAGQTLKSAKDYTAAEEMLQNAARMAPDDLAIRRQLGGLVALNLVHNRKETTDLYVE